MAVIFFGEVVSAGKPLSYEVPEGFVLNICQAALGAQAKGNASLLVGAENASGEQSKVVVCTLRAQKTEHTQLSLVFDSESPIVFEVEGNESVNVTGFLQLSNDEDYDGEDDEDIDIYGGEDSSEPESDVPELDSDVDEEPVNEQGKRPRPNQKAPQQPNRKQKLEQAVDTEEKKVPNDNQKNGKNNNQNQKNKHAQQKPQNQNQNQNQNQKQNHQNQQKPKNQNQQKSQQPNQAQAKSQVAKASPAKNQPKNQKQKKN